MLILIIFPVSSCKKRQSELKNLNKILLRNYGEKLKQKSFIIVIPQSGCPGCIDRAISFIKRNIENNTFYFVVLTNVTDKKYFTYLIGPNLVLNENFMFDESNEIGRASHITIYPKIFLLDKGKVKSIIEASPKEKNIWKKLSNDE